MKAGKTMLGRRGGKQRSQKPAQGGGSDYGDRPQSAAKKTIMGRRMKGRY